MAGQERSCRRGRRRLVTVCNGTCGRRREALKGKPEDEGLMTQQDVLDTVIQDDLCCLGCVGADYDRNAPSESE